jgi:hypothetical protein
MLGTRIAKSERGRHCLMTPNTMHGFRDMFEAVLNIRGADTRIRSPYTILQSDTSFAALCTSFSTSEGAF